MTYYTTISYDKTHYNMSRACAVWASFCPLQAVSLVGESRSEPRSWSRARPNVIVQYIILQYSISQYSIIIILQYIVACIIWLTLAGQDWSQRAKAQTRRWYTFSWRNQNSKNNKTYIHKYKQTNKTHTNNQQAHKPCLEETMYHKLFEDVHRSLDEKASQAFDKSVWESKASLLRCLTQFTRTVKFTDGIGTPDPNPISLVNWCL